MGIGQVKIVFIFFVPWNAREHEMVPVLIPHRDLIGARLLQQGAQNCVPFLWTPIPQRGAKFKSELVL